MSSQSCHMWGPASFVLFCCLYFNTAALPVVIQGQGHISDPDSQSFTPEPVNASGITPSLLSTNDSDVDPILAVEVQQLTGKTFDLDQCLPWIQLRLGDKILNKRSFYCTETDAMKLSPLLMGESLLDRMYVWCRTAQLYNSISPDANSFDVKDLNVFDDDIILSRENVDVSLAEFFPTSELRGQAMDAALAYRTRDSRRRAHQKRVKRKVIADRNKLWLNAVVPYQIINPYLRDLQNLHKAISEWEEKTCVRFVETNGPIHQGPNRVEFRFLRLGSRCSASGLGRSRYGTRVTLSPECAETGIVAHEIGHVLGFFHEHTRPDRDRYVTIVTQNINPDFIAQFKIRQHSEASTYGIPYDYSSVMHYASTSEFSITEGKTIVTTDPQMQFVIGQREHVSFFDAKLANVIYCSDRCNGSSLEWSQCKHGGYRNPNDCSSCLCPRGLAPPRCEHPAPGVKADCDRQTLKASGHPQTLTSPGYHDDGFPGKSSCFWLIKTSSPGKRIRLQFTGMFEFSTSDFLYHCVDYVEVRYKGLMRPGPRIFHLYDVGQHYGWRKPDRAREQATTIHRFCGSEIPEDIFLSHGEEMLIQIHNENGSPSGGFQVKYFEEYCGGCSIDANSGEPSCLRVVQYNCSQSDGDSTCFMEEPYCCDGYRLEGEQCTSSSTKLPASPHSSTPRTTASTSARSSVTPRAPSTERVATTKITSTTTEPPSRITTSATTTTTTTTTKTNTVAPPVRATMRPSIRPGLIVYWGGWSECSATCGLCGTQSRQRYCYGGYCYGNPYEVRRCGSAVCPPEIYNKSKLCLTVSTKSRKECVKNQCYSYQTYLCMEKAVKPRCCVGTPVEGVCRR